MHLQERRRTRLFMRVDDYGRYVSCLVFLPRDRYTTSVRQRMEEILRAAFHAATVDYSARVSESVLARLHFVVRLAAGAQLPDVDRDDLERKLVEATRSWDEDLGDALRGDPGEEEAARLLRVWGRGFPEAYKEDFPARVAVADLRRIEALDAGSVAPLLMNLYAPAGAAAGERRFKLYRRSPLSLTDVLPYLGDLGAEVVDERPYEIRRADGESVWVYDFGLRYTARGQHPERLRELFSDAFAAAWSGRAESGGFARLVLQGELKWRQVVVLRAYAKYLRQTGTTFSQDYIERALRANVELARLLVRLFEARFDPDVTLDADSRRELTDALLEEIRAALDAVVSLDHDRILRSFLTLVQATVRTNAFHRGDAGIKNPTLSLKLDPGAVPARPQPRPLHEIFVYSPLVEGVHLRFGDVARGGLRWSDRQGGFPTGVR